MNETIARTERRQHERAKTCIPVRYKRQDDETGAVIVGSMTCDVSAGGLRFRTSECISTACHLVLELDIPTSAQPISAVSKVAWVRDSDGGNEYEVGSQFMEISLKNQDLITQYSKGLSRT